MVKVELKPLSINKAYYGKLTKTSAHRKYIRDITYLLPKIKIPEPPYEVYLEWGFSSKASDIDNPTKIILDILANKYGFDDKQIYRLIIEKRIVKKGNEYIKFEIKTEYLKRIKALK